MRPNPIRPMIDSRIPLPAGRDHCCFRIPASSMRTKRLLLNIWPTVSSATARVTASGVQLTRIPLFLHSWSGTPSRPIPTLAIIFRWGLISIKGRRFSVPATNALQFFAASSSSSGLSVLIASLKKLFMTTKVENPFYLCIVSKWLQCTATKNTRHGFFKSWMKIFLAKFKKKTDIWKNNVSLKFGISLI